MLPWYPPIPAILCLLPEHMGHRCSRFLLFCKVLSSASDSCLTYVKMTKEQNYVRFYPILLYLNKSIIIKSNMSYAKTGENAWKIPQLEDLLLIQSNQTV